MHNKVYKKIDVLNQSLWSGIFLFSIPLILSNLLQVLFNMADVCVVGKFAGSLALGAVGSTTVLITLTTGLLIGMGSGVNAVVALYLGAKDNKNVSKAIQSSFVISFVMGLLLMALFILFSKSILLSMGTKNELIDDALLYYRIYLLGTPALSLYNFSGSVISASGDTKRPLKFLSIGGLVNIILNLIFVIIFKMSVVGVAIASIVSQYLSSYLCMNHIIKTKENFNLNLKELKIDRVMALRVLAIGIPSAIQYALFSFANLFVQSAVNSFSHIFVEGNAAAVNGESILFQMMDAIYIASTTFIAQNLGAKNKNRILKAYWICIFYSSFLGLIGGVLIYFFRYPFLSLFTNDIEVIEAGTARIIVMLLSLWISPFMDCSAACSRGLGKGIMPALFIILGTVVFRLIWIFYVFPNNHNIFTLYYLFPISWIITGIMETIYFFYCFKKIKFT
ncbi:MAG: MATE family efflux transporter [Eubacteriales bacterium]|nr:MATE family efflux transporter [Eubacteriales bacterium]